MRTTIQLTHLGMLIVIFTHLGGGVVEDVLQGVQPHVRGEGGAVALPAREHGRQAPCVHLACVARGAQPAPIFPQCKPIT
eukprot:8310370-Pyramimonas_sp.AAC.1